TSPAWRSTSRCLDTACRLTGRPDASWVGVAGPCASRRTTSRRVASARAMKTASTGSGTTQGKPVPSAPAGTSRVEPRLHHGELRLLADGPQAELDAGAVHGSKPHGGTVPQPHDEAV